MKTSARHRFLLTLFITVLGIFVVGNIRPEPISSVIQKDRFWATKAHSKKTYDIIISGDSRVYRGVDPASVSGELNGLQVLNFGFSSGGHNPLIFREIEKRLDKKANPKIIVLALTPYSLTKKAQENSHFIQEKERDQKEVLLRRYINPAMSFFDPIAPTDLTAVNDSIHGYHEKFRRDGWIESKKTPYDSRAALKSYVKDFKDNKIDAEVVTQVLKQVKEWQDQGILVFAIRMPTTKAMETLENELSGYEEEKLKMAFEKAGGRWIDCKNRYDYTSYDGSHLDGISAKRFSLYLGQELAEFLE